MPITPAEVVDRFHSRRKGMQSRFAKMQEMKRAYEGDIDLPLPELGKNERPLVANLVAQGVDQTANRIASVMPNVSCPPLRPGFDLHEDNANERRNVLLSWWDQNRLNLLQRRRARWLITQACAPVIIAPDPVRQIPKWRRIPPDSALPPPGDELCPTDMLCFYQRPLSWLRRIYPDTINGLDLGGKPDEVSPDTLFTMVEYVDHETFTTVVLGSAPVEPSVGSYFTYAPPAANPTPNGARRRGSPYVVLEEYPNRAGVCTAVYPTRIGLDLPVGQFDGVLGLYWNQAMLMALETIAVKKGVFPDRWKMARPGETVQTIVEADGMSGVVGELQGGVIQDLPLNPGVQTIPLINILERNIRLSAGIPAELTGESASNVRTARRGAQILSSAIDFAVQECQEIFEAALEEENARAIAIDRNYFKSARRAYYYEWNGKSGRGEYDSSALWVSDENRVRYAMPGADLNELVVGIGQRLGMETISHYRAMELDPLVEDPDLERDRIGAEALTRAFEQGLQQQFASGQIQPNDGAFIVQQRVQKGVTSFEAVMRADKRAQQRQASAPSAGPAEQPAALPPGSPEAQPGLAAGPEGAAAPAIPEPPPAMGNLQELLSQLK